MRRGLVAAGAALALTVTACSGPQPTFGPNPPRPSTARPSTARPSTPRPNPPRASTPRPNPPRASTAPATSTTPSAVPRTVAPPVKVAAAPDPCAKNTKPKAVLVRLSVQHMWLCAKSTVVRDSAVTSGMKGPYTETPTGHYEIQSRTRNTTLTLKSGKTYAVKYWIPFDAPLFGFHDSSWQDFAYGSAKYETDGSHGCVHLPLATIRFLYRWADVGTSVRIKA